MAKKPVAPEIRDRIVEFRRVPASEIMANPRNIRIHPPRQRRALADSLQIVGIADALSAYYSPRYEGKLTLIDGHGRLKDHPQIDWPVLFLDVTDAEADLIMATLDEIAKMAELDITKAPQLLDELTAGRPGLDDLLQSLRRDVADALGMVEGEIAAAAAAATLPSPPVSLPVPEGPTEEPPRRVESAPRTSPDVPPDLSGGDDTWVPLVEIFGTTGVPAPVARVIEEALVKMEAAGELGSKNRFQALELWAADYLAGA